jgi:uncharacterized protein YbjT (DUF2867 family)
MSSSLDTPVLVTGGTGTLGRQVVAQLTAAGLPPTVMSRTPGTGRVVADLLAGTGVEAALEGVRTVVNCVNHRRHGARGTRNLLEAAARAGVGHLVHVSIVGIEQVPLGYYREKLTAERLLADSSVPYSLLRATQFHDLLSGLLGALGRLPVMVLPARSLFQPVSTLDVARRLIELAGNGPSGRVTDFGGPEVLRIEELARLWLDATGRSRRLARLDFPGRIAAAVRGGALTTPDHAAGTVTFAEYLRR